MERQVEPYLGPAKNWAVLAEIAGVCCLYELPAEERIYATAVLLERELATEEMKEEFCKLAAQFSDKVVRAMNSHPGLSVGKVIEQGLEASDEQGERVQ